MPMTRAERVAAFLKDINEAHAIETERVDEGNVADMRARTAQESVGGPESMVPAVNAATLNAGLEAVDAGKTPTTLQAFGIEAIIIPDKRPAMPLAKGTYTATHPLWLHLNEPETKERLTRVARSIGRVEVPGSGLPYGGTAFVVGPTLLMTNRHVAGIFTSGLGLRHLDFLPDITPGFDTGFAPDNSDKPPLSVRRVVMVHPFWDMALIEVDDLPADAVPLTLEPGDVAGFDREEIAVIGYPAFDYRNDADVQRSVFMAGFGIKQLQPGLLRERADTESFQKIVSAATHDCSTLGGNSGSALVHIKTGKILGLHFGGLYLARNYAVPASELAGDGRVVDAGVIFDPKVRPDKPPTWSGAWDATETAEAPATNAAPTRPDPKVAAPPPPAAPVQSDPAGPPSLDVVIPIHITIRLGAIAPVVVDVRPEVQAAPVERLVEPAHDTDYAKRKGYDAMFLGLRAGLPTPLAPEAVARTRTGGARLNYQNFSVVMHAKRRIALFTASNISTEKTLRRPDPDEDYTRKGLGDLGDNDQERWFPDPRLDANLQLPDIFYTKDDGAFDKGHIVRREDVAWGETYDALRRANGDTFHVTNCSPQVAGFNRSASGVDNWGDLENAVFKQAATERLSLFAGPVLADDDPRFLGNFGGGRRALIQIPTRYWKVIVARTGEGLAAFGFVLEQDLSAVPQEEFVVPDAFRRFLQSLTDIQTMAGVTFAPEVLAADQFDLRGLEVARDAKIGVKRGA